VWSLLGGIPALIVNSVLLDRCVPAELGARVRVYPVFLVVSILVFFSATVLVELLYARRLGRLTDRRIGSGLASVPCAAIVPAAVGFPIKIHSKHTAVRAPRIGPTM
jgi:hypothetical protein